MAKKSLNWSWGSIWKRYNADGGLMETTINLYNDNMDGVYSKRDGELIASTAKEIDYYFEPNKTPKVWSITTMKCLPGVGYIRKLYLFNTRNGQLKEISTTYIYGRVRHETVERF